jgi:dynein heavy chain
MLVGVGGSGKQSLTRFAAHIAGCKVFQIELSRNYGPAEFRADLVKLYRTAGVDNEPVVFLFSDTQILQESFLEDINNMLNSGAQAMGEHAGCRQAALPLRMLVSKCITCIHRFD